MSYVVGLKVRGITSILCDTRVSFENGEGQNTSLKSGNIFPGCIYGGAGNAHSMREFIKDCKLSLTTKDKRLLTNYWKLFQNCIDNFISNETEPFQLILSSRHTGEAKLYSFDSKTKEIKEENNFVSIGSGKKLLDYDLKQYFDFTKDIFVQQLIQNQWELVFYPNFYCLWMMERLQGIEATELHKIGVGGYFHYGYQLNEGEGRQEPSLYVLNKRVNKTIYSYIYHITFEEAALVIACPTEDKRMVILDGAAWLKCEEFSLDERADYMNKICEQADKQPYYYFCGFGFLDLEQRGNVTVHMTKKSSECVVTREGKIKKEHLNLIKQVYALTVEE